MSIFDQLLDVQDHDTATDQLVHRRASLIERDEVAAAELRLTEIAAAITEADAASVDLGLRQRHLEVDVAAVEERVVATDAKLYSGNVTALKELQALQDEIANLRSRQGGLEDEIIVIMEETEALGVRTHELADERSRQDEELARANERLTVAEAEIDAELDRVRTERAALAAAVPADLLAEYERLRPQLDGVAVTRLQGDLCLGCHLSLSAVEVDRIKHEPPESVVHCGECGRILVR